MPESSPKEMSAPPSSLLSLRRRVQLCAIMLAVECYISFEEIFMVAVLRRETVPTSLVSLPGAISSSNGLYIIPLLGWASDRLRCPCGWGQKRPYALLSLAGMLTGVSLLVAVPAMTLHDSFRHVIAGNVTHNETDLGTTESGVKYHVQSSDGVSGLTVVGCLAILGFTLSDHFYTSCLATFRFYMIAVTPASQHDSLMVLVTLMGAVGGCVTSLLGYVDMAAVLLDSDVRVDRGVFQCLLQAAILLALVLVLGPVSLLTGSEPTADGVTPSLLSGSKPADGVTSALLTGSEPADRVTSVSPIRVMYQNLDNQETIKDDYQNLDISESIERDRFSYTTEELSEVNTRTVKRNEDSASCSDDVQETTPLVHPTSMSTFSRSKKKKIKKLVCLCVMAFLGFCTNYAYFVYVSNYVGEVIYNGDPFGQPDSDAYSRYVHGVHMSSLGMTLFYCLLVVFNLLHGKVLEKVGMKGEYLMSSVICLMAMVALTLTNNVVVFFATQVVFVAYRSVVYTVPFILVNKYRQQDLTADRRPGEKSSGGGLEMAVVTCTINVGYLLVSSSMGPLMALTAYPATPIVFASVSCALGTLATLFVKFE